MKRFAVCLLLVALLATMACPALAGTMYMGVTKKSVKVYADPERTDYMGTLAQYTVVQITDVGIDSGDNVLVDEVKVAGKKGYLNAAGVYDALDYLIGSKAGKYSATLKKGAKVYRRPSTAYGSVRNRKARGVTILAVRGNWAMVFCSTNGGFGFVKLSSLKNIRVAA